MVGLSQFAKQVRKKKKKGEVWKKTKTADQQSWKGLRRFTEVLTDRETPRAEVRWLKKPRLRRNRGKRNAKKP